jgi:hypothetical protein
LLAAVARRVRREGRYSWSEIQARDAEPVAQIAESVLGIDRTVAATWTVNRLVEALVDQVVAISELGDQWPRWRRVVEDFCHANRMRPEGGRGILLVLLDGDLASTAPARDVGTEVMPFHGVLSGLDVALFATERVRDEYDPHPADRRLHAALAAEVGGYDLQAVAALANVPLADLAIPERIMVVLDSLARARGWEDCSERELTWYSGRLGDLEGVVQESAVSLAARLQADAIRRRLWRAQVRVLFPFIEEVRMAVVHKHRTRIRTAAIAWGFRGDVEELEVGDLVAIGEAALPRSEREVVGLLRSARNALAHLQLADISCLNRRPLVEFWKSTRL